MSSQAGRLPAGRHGLPAVFVVENQRARLMLASAEVIAERGYAHVTAEAILKRARISKRTFYEQFSNLWDCLSATYTAASRQLRDEIEEACAGVDRSEGDGNGDGRQARLAIGVEAGLAWAATNPDFARLLCTEPPTSAETLGAARRELTERLAHLLRVGRPEQPDPSPPGLERRLVDAALSLVAAKLAAGDPASLAELAPQLTEILLRPYGLTAR